MSAVGGVLQAPSIQAQRLLHRPRPSQASAASMLHHRGVGLGAASALGSRGSVGLGCRSRAALLHCSDPTGRRLQRGRAPPTRASAAGTPTASTSGDQQEEEEEEEAVPVENPPRFLWRSFGAVLLAGQVVMKILKGKIHIRNLQEQLEIVGPKSLGVSLLTSGFVGMVFTIQFVREFARLGLTRSVGGVLALALARELTPVVTAIIIAGRVGSAFAAELGTMQVSEQTDSLRMLNTDPVDYLITPRVLACCIALPALTLLCFTVALGASVLLADVVYDVAANVILDSASKALVPWDMISALIKSVIFGAIISVVSCSWGMTTTGGAKGVGESTTSAVVISLVCIFISDFVLSFMFFQGGGDALTQLL